MVACFVSFVVVRIATVFLPRASSVFVGGIKKKFWHLVHVDDEMKITLRSKEHWMDELLELRCLLDCLSRGTLQHLCSQSGHDQVFLQEAVNHHPSCHEGFQLHDRQQGTSLDDDWMHWYSKAHLSPLEDPYKEGFLHFQKIYLLAWRVVTHPYDASEGAQCLMWGTRGPFLLAAAMVGYGCVGRCWPLEANVRLTYCRNSKKSLQKLLFLFLHRSHTFLTSDPAAKKEDFDILYALCSTVVTHHAKESWTLLSASRTDATLDIDTLFFRDRA